MILVGEDFQGVRTWEGEGQGEVGRAKKGGERVLQAEGCVDDDSWASGVRGLQRSAGTEATARCAWFPQGQVG